MKRLLFKIVLLVLPFALMLGFIEYRLRRIPNSYSSSKADLEARLGEIEVLITGSSHAQNGINPNHLGREAFNLANGSQSLYYDTALVSKYASSMPKLKLVIFVVSYHSLEYRLSNTIERWRAGFYKQVYGISDEDSEQGFQLSDYSYIALYTPKEAYRQVLSQWTRLNVAEAALPAEVLPETSRDINPEFGRKRVRLHESQMRTTDITYNVEVLERAYTSLKERNIQVVFMTAPLHHTYYDYIQPASYQRMQSILGQLSGKYGIEYFNYMHDTRFRDEDFFNSDHLNEKGAEKFSRILQDEVIPRYIR